MAQDGIPLAAATGTLTRTPLGHLVVYMLRRRLEGSIVLQGTVGDEHVVYFRAGAPALVKTDFVVPSMGEIALSLGFIDQKMHDETLQAVGRSGILHLELLRSVARLSIEQFEACLKEHVFQSMLALFRSLPASASYAFHPEVNLASTQEDDSGMPVDPYPLLWRAACTANIDSEIEATLGRLEKATVELPADAVVDDFAFGRKELLAVELLRGKASSLEALIGTGALDELQWKRVVYVLLITRNLLVGGLGRPSLSPPANPLRSQAPKRAAEPEGLVRISGSLYEAAKDMGNPAFVTAPKPVADGLSEAAARAAVTSRPPPEPRTLPPAMHGVTSRPPPLVLTSVPPPESRPRYLYFAFAAALAPLLLSLGETDSVERRLAETVRRHPELAQRLAQPGLPRAELLGALPDGRILGAHLAWDSHAHWLYAALAAMVFLGVIVALFDRGTARLGDIAKAGVFTGTAGIALLLVVQSIATATSAVWVSPGGGLGVLFYLVKFIGYSYRSALDPDNGMLLSFLGFTFGVGLCEELIKALPLLWHYRREGTLDWRGATVVGLGSGAAFGVVEGIFYSADHYNGVQGAGMYLVRFVSCVGLHAIWSASVGLAIEARQDLLHGVRGSHVWAANVLRLIAVPMLLHGLYDTLLKRGMDGAALVAALFSFGWLAWLIERSRQQNASVDMRRA
ncbi:MAG: PrsW family intramembrane metalloprotease [Deltaproteobacteria bacterium]|nr:PrsW family intramembrane metalloprotease [Deltaproteobacteria bacterium]